VPVARAHDLERLVVIVTANLADGHPLLISFESGPQTSRVGLVFRPLGTERVTRKEERWLGAFETR
jgi:hypothetical protein